MKQEVIKINISNDLELLSIIRLTASGVASKMGFDIEDIDDIKVAVSEACTNAMKHSEEEFFEVKFTILNDRLVIEVKDEGIGCDVGSIADPDLLNPKTNGLGIFIIKTLMDDFEIVSSRGEGTFVKITKVLGVED